MPLHALNECEQANHHEATDAQHHGDGEDPEEEPLEDAKQSEAADEEHALEATPRA